MKTLLVVATAIVLGWYVPFWSHTVREEERLHIAHAVQYIEQFRSANAKLPSHDEFLAWGKQEDLRGSRYDGLGFTLRGNCFPLKAIFRFGVRDLHPYCLNYWTGDAWVSYWSSQPSMDVVIVDDSGGAVVALAIFGALLYFFTRRHAPPERSEHRGIQ